MMRTFLEKIRYKYQRIVRLITDKRLKEAIGELKEFTQNTNNWDLQNKLNEIETAYNYMLGYMREDITDPKRTEMQQKLLRDTLTLADKAKFLMTSEGQYRTHYFNTRDKLQNAEKQYSLDSLLIELEAYTENFAVAELLKTGDSAEQVNEVRKRHEEMQSILFNMVWTTPYWTDEDEVSAKRFLESVLISENDLCLFVSAATLSLIENFDRKKLTFLFDAYNHENNQINQRALVGLVIIFQLYHARLPYYPEVVARLSLLNENEAFAQSLNRVQIQILLSKDTDKINKKMQEEIIPEMIKNANAQGMRINPDEHNEDDFNPDWMQNMENSAFGQKLREMSELQMEGADVYMSTFAYHKGYPFFHSIHNWFYPFDKHHSLVVKELGKGTGSHVIDLILESAFFCDSDKYSLLFTMMQIPPAQREMMTRQLSEQQINEMSEKSNALKALSSNPELISNQYIHNLYRFFKVYKYRFEIIDIFAEPIHLNEYEILKESMYKPRFFQELVGFLFRKEHYKGAASVYKILLKLEGDNVEDYQKLGYCYQKQKNYDEALKAYLKADMLQPDNVWTNRHLATCHRMKKDYGKAIMYYKKVEQVQPENRSLLYNIGSCMVELNQFDEALHYFFKLDFIEPDNLRTWRAIAWCSFMLKKLEQSMKFYDKIIEKNGVAPDYLNAGHVSWCMGDMKKAIKFYTKSCELSGSKALFLDIFMKDKEFLLQNNISEYDIALMYDLI